MSDLDDPLEIRVRDIRRRGGRYMLTIIGRCASMKNDRKIVKRGKKYAVIKSERALEFEQVAKLQVRRLKELIDTPVRLWITIWYVNPRSDLDEALVLDVLQDKLYEDDVQVFEKHVYKRFSKTNPRVEVEAEPLSKAEWEEIKAGLEEKPRKRLSTTGVGA